MLRLDFAYNVDKEKLKAKLERTTFDLYTIKLLLLCSLLAHKSK